LEEKAGHGAGKPVSKVLEELVDTWSFVFEELGVMVA
jgi:prolyl oligopeptidase